MEQDMDKKAAVQVVLIDIRRQHFSIVIHSILSVGFSGILANALFPRLGVGTAMQEFITERGGDPTQLDSRMFQEIDKIQVDHAKAGITSAALIFAHAAADALVYDLCRLSADLDASRWAQFVRKRKIHLDALESNSTQDILRNAIDEFLKKDLERGSILDKTEALFKALKPGEEQTHLTKQFDRDELKRIDKQRHECVHELTFDKQREDITKDIDFLNRTVGILINLVCECHKIRRPS